MNRDSTYNAEPGLGEKAGKRRKPLPVRWELGAIEGLCVGGPGFGELTGHAADFDDGDTTSEHGNQGHLELHPEGVPDVVGAELGEALGAVAACAISNRRFEISHF